MLAMAREAVTFAAGFAETVELGAEDASRADRSFLRDYCAAAVDAGARIVNIADTTGRLSPEETAEIIFFLRREIPAFDKGAVLSVHCHNDLGLALANTLAAVEAGVGQAEVTVCGIGERAGNAALEELAANLAARPGQYQVETALKGEQFPALLRLCAESAAVSPLKPVCGWNVRAHSSGIHQQGLTKKPEKYAAPVIEQWGGVPERIVLSRHSGKAGVRLFAQRYCGIELPEEKIEQVTALIKNSEGPAAGISEFIGLLARAEALPESYGGPLTCVSFSETSYTEHCQKTRYSLRAVIKTGRGELIETGGEAENAAAAVMAAARRIAEGEIRLLRSAQNGGGDRLRLYAEIEYHGQVCALERIGASAAFLLFQCCLDVINAGSVMDCRPWGPASSAGRPPEKK